MLKWNGCHLSNNEVQVEFQTHGKTWEYAADFGKTKGLKEGGKISMCVASIYREPVEALRSLNINMKY